RVASSHRRTCTDAEHPEVVRVNEIGLQLVDHRPERALVVPESGFEVSPGTVALDRLPEPDLRVFERAPRQPSRAQRQATPGKHTLAQPDVLRRSAVRGRGAPAGQRKHSYM